MRELYFLGKDRNLSYEAEELSCSPRSIGLLTVTLRTKPSV